MPTVFDPNQQNQDQQNQSGEVNLTGSGGQSTPGRTAQFSSGSTPTQKGSGRYTNLQKYLGANQGATDRLYQGIGSRLGKETQEKQQEVDTQASKVREGIQSANQSLQQGQGYLNQLGQQDFNAEQFVQDQNQLDQFSKFRTGQAIDQQQLGQQLSQAEQAALASQQQVQQRLGQVGSDAGRFNLLKETFGGRSAFKPTYSSGQQRLDQLFLQSGAGNKVGQLQEDLRQNLLKSGQGLENIQTGLGGQLKDIGSQASQLASGLQTKTGELESGYVSGLEGQVGDINKQREAERAKYEQFINQLGGKATGGELDPNLIREFNLMQNQQLFNVPKNLNTFRDVVNVDDRQAQTYKDIVTQQNINRYDALAKLAGIQNLKVNQLGGLIDTTTGQLSRAASAKTGDASLQNQIEQAKKSLLDKAASRTEEAYGRFGPQELHGLVNVGNYLQRGTGDFNKDWANLQAAGPSGQPLFNWGQYARARDASDADYKGAAQVSARAAQEQALNWLANQGYFNVLGSTGGQTGTKNLEDYREGGQYAPKKLI